MGGRKRGRRERLVVGFSAAGAVMGSIFSAGMVCNRIRPADGISGCGLFLDSKGSLIKVWKGGSKDHTGLRAGAQAMSSEK